MGRVKLCFYFWLFLFCFGVSCKLQAETNVELQRLQEGYPDLIKEVSPKYILWHDGSRTQVHESFALIEALANLFRTKEQIRESITVKGLHCDNYEPVFKKMYGHTAVEVKKNLVTIYWMPKVFGKRYPLKVTTVNGVDKKIQRISAKLEKLPPAYYKFLANPGGSFYWRNVASEKYLSAHSFGIALDINSKLGNYWLWDWKKSHRPFRAMSYHNNIPLKIVEIFEQEGFLWGGRWYFYDTMHFEYRPELFNKKTGLYNHELGLQCYG